MKTLKLNVVAEDLKTKIWLLRYRIEKIEELGWYSLCPKLPCILGVVRVKLCEL